MRACVYTCLIGGYETLNEQDVAAASELDFLCLTDDPGLSSRTWRIVQVTPAFALDPVRSQRMLKLMAHEALPDYDLSLYIDNSVILTQPPERIIAAYLPADANAAIPGHSFRASVADEFAEILRAGFDDAGRILEQLNHYQMTMPQMLADAPFWAGMMIRRHADPAVIAAMRLWAMHVLRYSRRDQVSANLAFREAGLEVARIDIDNLASWCHRWPVTPGRNRAAFPFSPHLSRLPAEMLAGEWRRREAELMAQVAALEAQLAGITPEDTRAQVTASGLLARVFRALRGPR